MTSSQNTMLNYLIVLFEFYDFIVQPFCWIAVLVFCPMCVCPGTGYVRRANFSKAITKCAVFLWLAHLQCGHRCFCLFEALRVVRCQCRLSDTFSIADLLSGIKWYTTLFFSSASFYMFVLFLVLILHLTCFLMWKNIFHNILMICVAVMQQSMCDKENMTLNYSLIKALMII